MPAMVDPHQRQIDLVALVLAKGTHQHFTGDRISRALLIGARVTDRFGRVEAFRARLPEGVNMTARPAV